MSEVYPGIEPTDIRRAERLQKCADWLTRLRLKHSDKVGIAIGATRRNWGVFAAATGMAATDFLDGYFAKKAQKLTGNNGALTNGPTEDPEADRRFKSETLRGMETRAIIEGDLETLAVVESKKHVDSWRDGNMADNRELAEKHGISTAAININRAKTALEMFGILVHISPVAENLTIRRFGLAVMGFGTGIGVYGERRYRDMVEESIAEQAAASPDRLREI